MATNCQFLVVKIIHWSTRKHPSACTDLFKLFQVVFTIISWTVTQKCSNIVVGWFHSLIVESRIQHRKYECGLYPFYFNLSYMQPTELHLFWQRFPIIVLSYPKIHSGRAALYFLLSHFGSRRSCWKCHRLKLRPMRMKLFGAKQFHGRTSTWYSTGNVAQMSH